jgi:hypothetical protein
MNEAVGFTGRSSSAGVDRERLLQVLSELSGEVGLGAEEAPPSGGPVSVEPAPKVSLSEEDERLVAGLRAGLALLAGGGNATGVSRAIDGAEFVARGDLLNGDARRLPEVLPSFVFLVLLPLLGKAEALRVADRAAARLAGTV